MKGVTSISKKSKYLNIPDLDYLHADCRKWLSEIAFWKDEMDFLKNIPHRYIEKINDENHIINLKFLMSKINGELTLELESLENKVANLESMLAGLIQNSFVLDEQKCRAEHKMISTRIKNYSDLYEETRTELRALIKNALKKAKK